MGNRSIGFLVLWFAFGCQPAPPVADHAADELLQGIVLRKEWTKSLESFQAGGSDYFVLKVTGEAIPLENQSASEGVILLASSEVGVDRLSGLVNREVVCRGRYVQGQRHTVAADSLEQVPVGSSDELQGHSIAPIIGAGFQVRSIDPVSTQQGTASSLSSEKHHDIGNE